MVISMRDLCEELIFFTGLKGGTLTLVVFWNFKSKSGKTS